MRITIAATCVVLAALTTGCGSATKQPVADQPSSGPSSTPTTSATPTPTPSVTRPVTPQCATRDLSITLGTADGAAGSTYQQLVMTNTSDHACRSGGYGGVSYVSVSGGKQVGAAADRDTTKKAVPFVLIPNAHASATLRETTAQNYPAARCRLTGVAGLRIYPPNQTAAVFVKAAGKGCANAAVHLLTIAPYLPVK